MEIDRNGAEVLGREECLRLLATATLGRIAVTFKALPTVLPVNFLLHDDRILMLTGTGSKLEAATRNAVVAFEVDDFDPIYHSGWSVVVTGVATEITDPDDLSALQGAPLARWASNGNGRVVAISTELVSGRRIGAVTTAHQASGRVTDDHLPESPSGF